MDRSRNDICFHTRSYNNGDDKMKCLLCGEKIEDNERIYACRLAHSYKGAIKYHSYKPEHCIHVECLVDEKGRNSH